MLFLLLLIASFALYCPIYSAICLLVPFKGFSVSSLKHRDIRYTVIHLALFSRVGHLNKKQLQRFNSAFVSTLQSALHKKSKSVVFRSHLMRTSQVRLAERVLAQYGYRHRVSTIVLSRAERVGITCQMLLQEWRVVRIPREGVMIVIMMR